MFLPPLSHSLRKPKLVQRRRNTCPSAQDISRALQSPSSAPSASAASLDELIQRCLNCFGQSVFPCRFARVPKVCHVSLLFITTRLHKWGRREREGGDAGWEKLGRGDKGQSHTIKLCSAGLPRPTNCSQAVWNHTNLSSPPRSSVTPFIWHFIWTTDNMRAYLTSKLIRLFSNWD